MKVARQELPGKVRSDRLVPVGTAEHQFILNPGKTFQEEPVQSAKMLLKKHGSGEGEI